MESKTTTTYSMWSLFRNCRKACEWRYIQELVPLERDHNLAFGTVIHKCLEIWHGGRDLGPSSISSTGPTPTAHKRRTRSGTGTWPQR